MDPIKCLCKQNHRSDYRQWSEAFQEWMTDREFVAALNSKRPMADPNDHLYVRELPRL